MKLTFKRKQARNFLDMIPVRNVSEYSRVDTKITLHVPKFKSRRMQQWLIPRRRSTHFRIHLDETGSQVWDLIDGVRDTRSICEKMEGMNANKPAENLELRITEFLRKLYKNRFILFR